jgi:phosphoribosylaminoimidazole-succinocarboxamide synthase
MTSVKDFRIDEPATPDALGRGAFVFTDDYSVFDWGKMPDVIPDKGVSLCSMGAFNFELLEAEGVPTHYRGVLQEGEAVPFDRALDAGDPPREMAIDLTQVPDLPVADGDYDYAGYHEEAGANFLVPLEIVFRNRVGVGSSLRTRTAPTDHGLPYDDWPEDAVDLEEPVIEFSTKYEEQDRYLDRDEADRIAGAAEIEALADRAREVNRLVTEQAESADMVHQDGKIECLYYRGEVRVADVVGTFDENRFSYDGQQVSKEVIRQYHKRTQSEWVEAVGGAKAAATDRGVADWKGLCDVAPQPLDESVIQVARDLYCAGTNAYTDRAVFEAPTLAEAVEAVGQL